MRRIIITILISGILFISENAFAKAGPPIPTPNVSISEAINIAKAYFYKEENRVIDGDYFKVEDYILISAQYTNYFHGKYQKEWTWIIEFVHPIQNDHSRYSQ